MGMETIERLIGDLPPNEFRVFVRESNRIEGLSRVLRKELEAHAGLLRLSELSVGQLQDFVSVVAPGKRLRRFEGMNVRVGNHRPPPGGADIERELLRLLARANAGEDPFVVHCAYETLHPFMDGNGRSGRAIWLWQMIRQRLSYHALQMGFLHLFYYQTLQRVGRPLSSDPQPLGSAREATEGNPVEDEP